VTKGFDHEPFFVLRGAHTSAACTDCHAQGFKKGQTPTKCVGCHQQDYDRSPLPGHDKFATTCADCHTETAWKPAKGSGDHDKFFPLDGAHLSASCSDCHTKGFDSGKTPKQCVGCHQKDYDSSPLPGHDEFATTCADCHTTQAWKPAKSGIDHDKLFPLDGAHGRAACADCHTQGFAAGQTPNACVGCHQKDYDGSSYPGHSGFPTSCADCHSTTAWMPATSVDHDRVFPLQNAHAMVACASCHTTGFGAGQTPNACVGCHQKDYDGSPYPGHSAFPTTCGDCHSTVGWTPASGSHPNDKFPITSGAHKIFTCGDCHNPSLGPNGAVNADCVGCHTGQHTRAKMDAKHVEESKYPTGAAPPNFCLDCHPRG
jgi:hypothetical protein